MNEKYNIEAIETKYNGYHFRSRLEARWAVFFDAIGLEYVYEYQDFILPNKGRYLPDFYFPKIDCYAEVKPYNHKNYFDLCFEFSVIAKKDIILLDGVPDIKAYKSLWFDWITFDYEKIKENQLWTCESEFDLESQIPCYNDLFEAVHASRSARFETY